MSMATILRMVADRQQAAKPQKLVKPASDKLIEKSGRTVAGVALPKDLLTMYRWSNGEKRSGLFKPCMEYMSLEGAFLLHETYSDLADDGGDIRKELRDFWPIFYTESKVDIGVFVSRSVFGSGLYGVSVDVGNVMLLAPTLQDYLSALNLCWKSGVYADGRVAEDDPFSYLPLEKKVFKECFGEGVFPLGKKKGVTYFSTRA